MRWEARGDADVLRCVGCGLDHLAPGRDLVLCAGCGVVTLYTAEALRVLRHARSLGVLYANRLHPTAYAARAGATYVHACTLPFGLVSVTRPGNTAARVAALPPSAPYDRERLTHLWRRRA